MNTQRSLMDLYVASDVEFSDNIQWKLVFLATSYPRHVGFSRVLRPLCVCLVFIAGLGIATW